MKVFFSYSISGKTKFNTYYEKIATYLDQKGYTHVNEEIKSLDPKDFYEDLSQSSYENRVKVYSSLLDKISKADICIFESSSHSLSTGFLIQKSLEMNKPVIALYLTNFLPYFLTTIKEEKFQLVKYNENNLIPKLDDALEKAKQLTDKRFNFFISPRLLSYLNKASKEEGITKSTFIRNLINDYRRKLKQ